MFAISTNIVFQGELVFLLINCLFRLCWRAHLVPYLLIHYGMKPRMYRLIVRSKYFSRHAKPIPIYSSSAWSCLRWKPAINQDSKIFPPTNPLEFKISTTIYGLYFLLKYSGMLTHRSKVRFPEAIDHRSLLKGRASMEPLDMFS